jgi:hypothetical protein
MGPGFRRDDTHPRFTPIAESDSSPPSIVTELPLM